MVGTVTDVRTETPTGRSLTITVDGWPGNLAGQHLDLRLTAPDGYQAVRSYSIASVGDGPAVQLAVDKITTGEVSPYLVDDVLPGDQLEVRGPLGRWFVWTPEDTRPIQLIAGGSGIVPLIAMARAHAASGSIVPFRLLYSVRSPQDRFFADEIAALESDLFRVDYVYTRSAPEGWATPPGRVTPERISAATIPVSETPGVFVCGPTGFVETVARALVDLGHEPQSVKTERFGGS
ncbi:oxidoreductase [Labedella endophytica]|uniref:Oxidoreductase n=1 Tax=Labedella endophytica TaxID=1523160 RepID=A0A3S0Y1D3_9MICO|nr:oxidoreductase [Labedella endophytica]